MATSHTSKSDPVTYEIVSHRLHQITREMGATLERSGCTVNTTQARDYIAALYRADGDILCAGDTLIWQVPCAGLAVKAIIRRFEREGGIYPGDVFMLNDPYVAAVHQSDVYVLAPIHYEDRLVAWSATFVHVMDIGAMSFGGNSPGAREICQEGVRIAGIKLLERGQLRRDVMDAIINMTRQPVMVELDLKCEIAANNVARERVQELFRRYGSDVVEQVAVDMIRHSESRMRRRISDLPDGRWEATKTIDADRRRRVMVALMKQDDHLLFDFTGTDSQAPIGINLPVHGTFGACFGAVAATLGYDIPKNHGMSAPLQVVAPPGTMMNPQYPAPVSLATSTGGALARYLASSVIAQMLATSEQWQGEVTAQNAGNRYTRTAGINRYGLYYAASILPLEGGGASAFRDGTDSWGVPLNRDNIEWAESTFPLLHLFCRHPVDAAGAGKYRGGVGEERALIVHDAPERKLNGVAFGVVGLTNSGQGLFGGYPAAPSLAILYADTRVREMLDGSVPPVDLAALGGNATQLPYCEFELGEGDVLYMRSSCGGGYGDPLQREPQRVLTDVIRGLVSEEAAREVYGVEISAMELDLPQTQKLRQALRDQRRELASEPIPPQAAPLRLVARMTPSLDDRELGTQRPFREHLAVRPMPGGAGVVRCLRCGFELCHVDEDWTRACRRALLPATAAGPLMSDLTDGFLLEQLSCPSCGTLLNSQMVEIANSAIGNVPV